MPHGIRNDRRLTSEQERLRVCESIYETDEIFGRLIEPRTEKRTWHCPPSNGQQGQRWTPNHLLLDFLLLMDDVTLTPIPLFNKRFHRPPPFPLLPVQAVFSLLSAIRILCVTRSIVSISDWSKTARIRTTDDDLIPPPVSCPPAPVVTVVITNINMTRSRW